MSNKQNDQYIDTLRDAIEDSKARMECPDCGEIKFRSLGLNNCLEEFECDACGCFATFSVKPAILRPTPPIPVTAGVGKEAIRRWYCPHCYGRLELNEQQNDWWHQNQDDEWIAENG